MKIRITKKNLKIAGYIASLVLVFVIPFFICKYTTTFSESITINVRMPEYTVVFHSNDGNNTTTTQSFVYGTSQQLNANTFTYADHVFARWNTASDGSGTSYQDQATVNNLTGVDGATFDLYAQWAPDFTITGNAVNWTNQDVTLTIVLTAGSNYNDYEYSFDNGATWSSSYSATFSSNQDVYVKIRDNYGYESVAKVESITKIDKVPPVITYANDIEYNPDHSTESVTTLIAFLGDNTSITTGMTVTDDLSGVASGWPKCYRNNSEITTTYTFTMVGRYAISCKAQDNAGNETTENREVLIRWPLAGKYVVARTTLTNPNDPNGYVAPGLGGTGLSSSTSPDGLYRDNASTGANVALPFASKYYYTGPTAQNYITFAGTTFRILNVPTNDDVKLLGDVSDTKVRWGPSYDTNNRKIYLSNTYDTWSTKWWPRGQIYNNETGESKYKLFTATENAHLDLATFYAGRFNKSDAVDISYTVYYEQTGGVNLGGNDDPAFQGYSAYPNVSDYLKSSKAHDQVINIDDTQGIIRPNGQKIFTENTWIDLSQDQWTMNSKNLTSTDNDFWCIEGTVGNSKIQSRTFYYEQQYRVVFYLKYDTILSGTGLSTDPYNVEEDWAWFDSYQTLQ